MPIHRIFASFHQGVGYFVTRWVDLAGRRAIVTLLLCVVAAVSSVLYAREHLGINTDTASMFSDKLPWRKTLKEFEQAFPQYDDTLTIVVEAVTPDLAAHASRLLSAKLAAEHAFIEWVYRPDGGPFFEQNALLFLDQDELEDLADQLAEAQPLLAKLSQDPSLRGLFSVLGTALEELREGSAIELAPVLKRVTRAVEAALAGRFYQLSWQELMLGRDAKRSEKRRFIIVRPKLDFKRLFAAGPAIDRIRNLSAKLGLDLAHGVRVRITGALALSHEELKSLSEGMVISSILSLVLVGFVVHFGLRSARLVIASMLTLVVGLTWTTAFAAFAVGSLNLISIAFAVLYIGLGIDYSVHFCLRYRELVAQGASHASAMSQVPKDVGKSLALCAITTGAGFFAFIPTEFSGVSELGLISGTGSFINLVATLTLLPALLRLMPLAPGRLTPLGRTDRLTLGSRLSTIPTRFPKTVLAIAGVLALASACALPYARFDYNPLNLRDPNTESVQTYRDLLADSATSPWTASVLVKDKAHVAPLKARLNRLPSVEEAIAVDDFVPKNQEEKLALIEEIALTLGPEAAISGREAPPTPQEQKQAIADLEHELASFLASAPSHHIAEIALPLEQSLQKLAATLRAPGETPEKLVDRLDNSLVSALPEQMRVLNVALTAQEVSLGTLPKSLVERWRTPDGQYKIEVFPKEDLNDNTALHHFVTEVRSVAPNVTEAPVINLESGKAVVHALQLAFLYAFGSAAVLIGVLLKSALDAVLVLMPLLLGGLFSVGVLVLTGLAFNFANIITLPLLLGISVDNGIHVVHRMRAAHPSEGRLLQTSTARAVVLAALTNMFSMGTLMLSPHRGTAGMGQLLTIGLGAALICTLVILPALLDTPRLRARSRAAATAFTPLRDN
ncbi:MAG: MMPL family transporter [Gammaproteobacteria bacterium]